MYAKGAVFAGRQGESSGSRGHRLQVQAGTQVRRTLRYTGLILLVPLAPAVIMGVSIKAIGTQWLPLKLSTMVPAVRMADGDPALYMDREPRSLYGAHLVLFEELTKTDRSEYDPDVLVASMAASQGDEREPCEKVLLAALSEGEPLPAQCISGFEAQT